MLRPCEPEGVNFPMTLRQLFLVFFKISATAFGGGIAVIGVTKQEMEARANLSEEELTNYISLATAMPGPLAVSIAYLIGRHYHKTLGAAIAILGAALPPFLLLIVLSPFILDHLQDPAVLGFFRGVLAGVAVLISIVVVQDAKDTLKSGRIDTVIYLFVLVLIGGARLHPLIAITSGLLLQRLLRRFSA